MVPIVLERGAIRVDELGLLDSGADTSILPYDLGLRLGLDWNSQPMIPSLGGIFAGTPVRGVILLGTVHPFPSVRLGFAWIQTNNIPLILGQMNFFAEFDIAFYRHRSIFKIEPRTP
jgi:hypothetical protein